MTGSESISVSADQRRWYEQDPVLSEVLDLLKTFPDDLRDQAQQFLNKVEAQVGKATLDAFYEQARPQIKGRRWYDNDPVISRAVELLRVLPPEAQRQAAQRFLDVLKAQGLNPEDFKR